MSQQASPAQYRFHNIELFETEELGIGSYGRVCKAKCDELLCAAKILHPIIFSFNDPGSHAMVEKFEQECHLLSGLKHPHIIQYLSTYRHPESNLPVLLMELMEESLTRFLEHSTDPLSFHTQTNLCHDIVLALAYLHSNGIIHRDLSSNNVLLTAGHRAKVTDFGVSKIVSDANPRFSALTQCPGCVAYMAPEALSTPPTYTAKLDDFSFGVLTIQILTRKFPNPSPPMERVHDSRYPTAIQVPVLDKQRRKSHIDLIETTHPLLTIALDCLEFDDSKRPSAQELCDRVAEVKGTLQYSSSMQQTHNTEQGKSNSDEDVSCSACVNLQRKLESARDGITKLNHDIDERKKSFQELLQKASVQEEHIYDLKDQLRLKDDELQRIRAKFPVNDNRNSNVNWNTLERAPCKMFRGATASEGSRIYFNPNGTKQIYVYDTENQGWSGFPDCIHTDFGLVVVNSLLTAVGGDRSQSEPTEKLLSFVRGRQWSEHFPPMPTKRFEPAVICSNHLLVVAGGKTELGGGRLCTVEVMDTITLQWSTAASLPTAVSGMSITVARDRLYLLGGFDERGASTTVFTCTLAALCRSYRSIWGSIFPCIYSRSTWNVTNDIPVYYSTCTTLSDELLAIGGLDSRRRPTSAIHTYNPDSNSWEVVSHMPTARYDCLVSVLPGNRLIVAGGCTSSSWGSWTDVMEIGTPIPQGVSDTAI